MPDIPNAVQRGAYDLQAQNSDPLCAYIYDLPGLRHHVAGIVQTLPTQCEMFYATKANPALPVLQAPHPGPWV